MVTKPTGRLCQANSCHPTPQSFAGPLPADASSIEYRLNSAVCCCAGVIFGLGAPLCWPEVVKHPIYICHEANYAYDPDNRLTNRWSAAKGNTKYRYDPVGNLTNVVYPGSPSVSLAYDPLNRVTTMVDAAGTTAYTYTSGDQLLTEDGPFSSDTLTNTYVNRLRTSLAVQQPPGLWTNKFVYDAAGRLTNVTSPAGVFGYTLGGSGLASPLIRKLLLPNTSYITNTFDSVARLTGTWLNTSGNITLDSAVYGYNLASQRTAFTNAAGTYVAYAYDRIGQLKVADSSVNSEDRGYLYDAAWNLSQRTNNGSLSLALTVDNKNQLSSDGTYTYTYDGNGNLVALYNGYPQVMGYNYDDENRLTGITYNDPSQPTSAWWQTVFKYDGLGRMRERDEYTWLDGYGWYPNSQTDYIYDGMRVIQERGNSTVSYTRGTDLSGTLEGAGGIGGLLARSSGSTHLYYHADGSGNITYLVNSGQGLAASYRYDPFGNTISQSGTFASANVYRFSSKEIHLKSGLYYYGYRFYSPNLQRWLSKDPWRERGFEALRRRAPVRANTDVNAYLFVRNRPLEKIDPLGLSIAALEQSQQACQVLTVAAETLGAAMALVPASAIITGTVVVGGVVFVSYMICNPPSYPRTWCPSQVNAVPTTVTFQQPQYKTCYYWCDLQGLIAVIAGLNDKCPDISDGGGFDYCVFVGESN